MSDMIKRIAQILEPQAWAGLAIGDTSLAYKSRRTSSLRKARAAIEAMRQPDTATILEATKGGSKRQSNGEFWRAIIDATLCQANPHPLPVTPSQATDSPTTISSPSSGSQSQTGAP